MITHDEMNELLIEMDARMEAEKKKIVNDIHDSLSADVSMSIRSAKTILSVTSAMENCPAVSKITDRANAIVAQMESLRKTFREVSDGLRPEMLEILGLKDAIQDMVDKFNSSSQSCRTHFGCVGDISSLGKNLSLAIFRVVQEALSNIMKHANATIVEVEIIIEPGTRRLLIGIEDNGTGFDTSQAKKGIGLLGMRQRIDALKLDGKFTIESKIGSGTSVLVSFPPGSC